MNKDFLIIIFFDFFWWVTFDHKFFFFISIFFLKLHAEGPIEGHRRSMGESLCGRGLVHEELEPQETDRKIPD